MIYFSWIPEVPQDENYKTDAGRLFVHNIKTESDY